MDTNPVLRIYVCLFCLCQLNICHFILMGEIYMTVNSMRTQYPSDNKQVNDGINVCLHEMCLHSIFVG